MAIKEYTKQFTGLLPDIFASQAYFLEAFGGAIQVKDGVSNNDTFMELKISAETDAVLQEYKTDANTGGFGDGTGGNRFGARTEIKSVNKQVAYNTPLAIHEGIDAFTVNDVPEQVIAERLAKHSEAWADHTSKELGKKLSTDAGKTINNKLTEDGVKKAFAEARKELVNNKVRKDAVKIAYVTSDVYDILLESKLTTTAKGSSVNIDRAEVLMFKGFAIIEVPSHLFQTGDNIYFVVANVGVVGMGIQVARALDSEDFYGIALQGAGKDANYIPDKNKKAIVKAQLAPVA